MIPALSRNEPAFTLPGKRLLVGSVLACSLFAAGWVGVTVLLGKPTNVQWAGFAGAGVAVIVAVAGVLVMNPSRARPASTWMTLWLAGTVIRMLAAPALTFVLYFAAPLNAVALTLAVAGAYLIVLLTETAMIASHVSRATAQI